MTAFATQEFRHAHETAVGSTISEGIGVMTGPVTATEIIARKEALDRRRAKQVDEVRPAFELFFGALHARLVDIMWERLEDGDQCGPWDILAWEPPS